MLASNRWNQKSFGSIKGKAVFFDRQASADGCLFQDELAKHGGSYMIYNVSGLQYDYSLFDHQVLEVRYASGVVVAHFCLVGAFSNGISCAD